jgi:HAD superfamily hydrolase (TIGR01509 family)
MPAPGESPALLFDVMDTLVYDPYREMAGFFGMPARDLYAAANAEAWYQFERGEIDQQTFLDSFLPEGPAFDHAAFLDLFRHGYRWLDGMREVLEQLQQRGIEMHCMSNYPRWFEVIEDCLGLSRYLPWTFVSCKTGLRKPSPEAYLSAAQQLQREPSECLFIDNKMSNCQAARAVGMDSVHFVTAELLRSELHRRGLLELQPASG